jgi:hypothetical protein
MDLFGYYIILMKCSVVFCFCSRVAEQNVNINTFYLHTGVAIIMQNMQLRVGAEISNFD